MRLSVLIATLVAVASYAGSAQAAGLPGHLTPIGAERAGNAEGTIPEWTGGYTGRPAGFVSGSGTLPDPFADDKVLFSITAENMDQYADKLSDGQKAMFKKYPKTYRMDIYPTHRSASYTPSFVENTAKNMDRCSLIDDEMSLDTSKGCGHGIPFPIPKNGIEAMWNHHARPNHPAHIIKATAYYVKPSGEIVIPNTNIMYLEASLYDERRKNPDRWFLVRAEYTGPARILGQTTIYYDDVIMSKGDGRTAHSYQPASRRVRLAPDLANDTPIATTGGALTYDDGNMFGGKMDRFDFKLLGKKEMYIPYNLYKLDNATNAKKDDILWPGHLNPDYMRWELHRVVVIEATLKAGKRHIYPRRMFYYDEDVYHGGIMDNYDANGKIFRSMHMGVVPNYEFNIPAPEVFVMNDLVSGVYYHAINDIGHKPVKMLPRVKLSPDSMTTLILHENMK